jgi:hypothetical protein
MPWKLCDLGHGVRSRTRSKVHSSVRMILNENPFAGTEHNTNKSLGD